MNIQTSITRSYVMIIAELFLMKQIYNTCIIKTIVNFLFPSVTFPVTGNYQFQYRIFVFEDRVIILLSANCAQKDETTIASMF